jgi:hypothetical protein
VQDVDDGYDIDLAVQLLHLWGWEQKVGFDIAHAETIFVFKELVAEIEVIDDIIADKIVLWNAIDSQSSHVLAHIASDVEEFAASFE